MILHHIVVICALFLTCIGACRKVCQKVDVPTNPFELHCYWMYISDTNKDHVVTLAEFKTRNDRGAELDTAYYKFLDLNEDGVVNVKDDPLVVPKLDTNKNNGLEYDEVYGYWIKSNLAIVTSVFFERTAQKHGVKSLDKTQFRDLFSSIQGNADGSITRAQLKAEILKFKGIPIHNFDASTITKKFDTDLDKVITKTELESMFAGLDTNGDGKVAYREFVDTLFY